MLPGAKEALQGQGAQAMKECIPRIIFQGLSSHHWFNLPVGSSSCNEAISMC